MWRAGEPVGIIDWDYAAPAPALDDVAYALEWAVPFCPDDECVRWRRFPAPPARAARIAVFASAYGLESVDGLVDAVIARQERFHADIELLAARGIQPAVDEVAGDYLDVVRRRIRWSRDHRPLLERSPPQR